VVAATSANVHIWTPPVSGLPYLDSSRCAKSGIEGGVDCERISGPLMGEYVALATMESRARGSNRLDGADRHPRYRSAPTPV
jgi:hypothetical protein